MNERRPESENALVRKVFPHLQKDMLCLADRYCFGCELWNPARKRGADLLWRLKGNAVPLREKTLAEGSYLSTVYPSSRRQGRRRRGVRVRVVEERPD